MLQCNGKKKKYGQEEYPSFSILILIIGVIYIISTLGIFYQNKFSYHVASIGSGIISELFSLI